MLDPKFTLAIKLIGTSNGTELERAKECLSLADIVSLELPKVRAKCESFPFPVLKLYLSGVASFESVEITYLQGHHQQTEKYTLSDFYNL